MLKYTLDIANCFHQRSKYSNGYWKDDIKAFGQVHIIKHVYFSERFDAYQCIIKSGGFFFFGLTASKDISSYIELNTYRVYGHKDSRNSSWARNCSKKPREFRSVFFLRKRPLDCWAWILFNFFYFVMPWNRVR